MNYKKGNELEKRLHQVIPAGAHTYSKGRDQFPEQSPKVIVRGKGAYCWDVDGNKFVDYGMGLRSVCLGHADEEINAAVREQLELGTNFTRPGINELECAERFIELIPSIEMVKFAKNGSDVTAAAVRLARAFTGKKYIAICNQPFFSFYDWFIAVTPCNNGIPEEIQKLSLKFEYNNIRSLEELFEQHPDDIAAIILEPVKSEAPADGFLEKVRELTAKMKTVLIFDEMITGFRWHLNGAQTMYGVKPDLTTFGKGCANGFSVSVLGGKREIMELGGLDHNKPRVFLLSCTHGAEATGLAAAIKNIEIFKRDNVVSHHWEFGKKFKHGINSIAKDLGVSDNFKISGFDCSPIIEALNRDGKSDPGFYTLFCQEMISKGVLINWVAFSKAHGDAELEITMDAAKHALSIYKQALENGWEQFVTGPKVKPVWRKFN